MNSTTSGIRCSSACVSLAHGTPALSLPTRWVARPSPKSARSSPRWPGTLPRSPWAKAVPGSAPSSKATARAALYEHLLAINVTARAVALDTPGLETKFRMPRSGTDQALLTAGRAFAADAVPLAGAFQQHEMPVNFIDELHADIAALEEALSGRVRSRDAHVAATAALEATVERGIKAVQRLQAIVRNKFRDDPAVLAAWESASHVERRSRTVTPPQPEPPPPSTPPQ